MAFEEPAGQLYLGAQGPMQVDLVSLFNKPNRPPGQSLQLAAPDTLYVPARHLKEVADVDPAPQLYPAVHGPEHADEF